MGWIDTLSSFPLFLLATLSFSSLVIKFHMLPFPTYMYSIGKQIYKEGTCNINVFLN